MGKVFGIFGWIGSKLDFCFILKVKFFVVMILFLFLIGLVFVFVYVWILIIYLVLRVRLVNLMECFLLGVVKDF